MRYAVTTVKTVQNSPDSWGTRTETMIADDNTTISDIRKWYDKFISDAHRMTDIEINQILEAK